MHATVFILGVIAVAWFFFGNSPGIAGAIAADVRESCAKEPDRGACYEKEMPILLESMSLEDVFQVIRLIREKDTSYQFCHVLAHKLGEKVVAQDPARWIEAMALNPSDGLCSNGFIHGVVGGKFRAEVLDDATLEKFIPDFSRACKPRVNWQPSLLDQAICYHGMGHLYMFITDADISKALSICERTSISNTGDFRRVCREGVFMQIYQPLEPDDFLMIERMAVKPTKKTVRQFCARFTNDAYEGACLRESWPYVREELLKEKGAIDTFCSDQPNAEEESACYDAALSIIGRQTLGNEDAALTACSGLRAEEKRSECYARVALAYLEEDRGDPAPAVTFCRSVPEAHASGCLAQLSERAEFIFGEDTAALRRFCVELPFPFQRDCGRGSSKQTISGIVQSQ